MPIRYAAILALSLAAGPAAAYIGPGAGISFVGAVLTTIAGILLALLAILAWPVRKLIKRMRGKQPGAGETESPETGQQAR